MMRVDLAVVLARMGEVRPIFHSEADFQHALAWALQEDDRERRVRLEYRAKVQDVINLDVLVVERDGHRTAIELKYWTKALTVTAAGEEFRLRNQGAHDISRYDFVKDICRVESLVAVGEADDGWVCALTNDPGYWRPPTRPDTVDAAFRLSEGRELSGALAWSPHAGAGTTRGRTSPHHLRGAYPLGWVPYSTVDAARAGEFRHLTLRIPGR